MPVRMRNGASRSLSAATISSCCCSRSRLSPWAMVRRGEWSVSTMYSWPRSDRRPRPSPRSWPRRRSKSVQVAVAAERVAVARPPRGCSSITGLALDLLDVAGHAPASASVISLAVAAPMPARSVSVPSAARAASSSGRSRARRRAPARTPWSEARLVGPVEAVDDAVEGLYGRHAGQATSTAQEHRGVAPPAPVQRAAPGTLPRDPPRRPRGRPRHLGWSASSPTYERAAEEAVASEEQVRAVLFGEHPTRVLRRRGGRRPRRRYGRVVPELLHLARAPRHLPRGSVRDALRRGEGHGKALLATLARRLRRAWLRSARMVRARLEPARHRLLLGPRRRGDGRLDGAPAHAATPSTPWHGRRPDLRTP